MAFEMEVNLSWDWGGLIKNATNVVFHNQLLYEQDVARYPNNEFWLAFLVILFKIVRMFYASATIETFKTVSIVVSCVFVQLTIFFIHKTAKLVWNEKYFRKVIETIVYSPSMDSIRVLSIQILGRHA